MYDNTIHRDYVKTELEYRLDRVHSDIATRRQRRRMARSEDQGGLTWNKLR
ncbi:MULTISPECIES: hypothetical protein [unclassified Nocardioides]|uniref:hypothetical protein n=1 Tax=unclassified Nocardioides TaxID=2615069 RepID=UPI000B093202|nr:MULTISPECIES: hypothetical protein [unclassified Nocardioides]